MDILHERMPPPWQALQDGLPKVGTTHSTVFQAVQKAA